MSFQQLAKRLKARNHCEYDLITLHHPDLLALIQAAEVMRLALKAECCCCEMQDGGRAICDSCEALAKADEICQMEREK